MSFLEIYRIFTFAGNIRGRYIELNDSLILSTIQKLEKRIGERFPESGLRQVCLEFETEAKQARTLSLQLGRPIWPVRIASVMAGLLLLLVAVSAIAVLVRDFSLRAHSFMEILQVSESALNELIFLALALFFLVSLEKRLKQHTALKAIHRLRSLAHVVDMHQLTKDPAHLLSTHKATDASPQRILTHYELTRYLDYCSEMLALISKVAALFAQYMDDPVILNAVKDMESLTQGLSGKIWQKIMILDLAIE